MSSGIVHAVRYHRHLFERIKPFIGSRVWEIGSGFGQYTRMLLEAERQVLASDIDRDLLGRLAAELAGAHQRMSCRYIDLGSRDAIAQCLQWQPDSIVCLNVLEHIRDDVQALRWIREESKGSLRAVFLVPAHKQLFGFMDEQAGHFRRYTRDDLSAAFTNAGWRTIDSFYLNPVGGVGWFVRNRIMPPASEDLDDPKVNRDIEIFDRYFLSISKLVERFTQRFFGQSVVVVADRS